MNRILPIAIASVLALAVLVPAMAGDSAELKAAYEEAVRLALQAPQDYTLNWQAARAARRYGDHLVTEELPGWKETARTAAKDGMKYGEIAFKLNPTGIEGWYWYGLSVGIYSDCVSIIRAFTEGLKGKTQMSFENAYKYDKSYENGDPILSLGCFWLMIPGIAGQDRKKAEQLFDEYIGLYEATENANNSAWYYRGRLYKDTGRADLARADLEKAAGMGCKPAARLLAQIK